MITFVNMNDFNFISRLLEDYPEFKNERIRGRYFNYALLKPELEKLDSVFKVQEVGRSELNVPIHAVSFGLGPKRIFGWSQMHGNESTTTKALFDLFSLFSSKRQDKQLAEILEECSFMFIPMLNPDGADRYTRENYNGVDLNRDAEILTQKESRVLRACFEKFDPDFCFNLHDQRTIFSAGSLGKPATVSFLAPAMDEERSLSGTRKDAMKIVVAMNKVLQEFIPGQVGRFDDSFNINCSGDKFQTLGVPTILFEAGHFPGDYLREETRKYIFIALLEGIRAISSGNYLAEKLEQYHSIPENRKEFCDILLKNVLRNGEKADISIQYKERINQGNIIFDPVVQLIQQEIPLLGHKTIDCKGQKVVNSAGEELGENDIVEGILLNTENTSLKIE